jgi:hypothetical protein
MNELKEYLINKHGMVELSEEGFTIPINKLIDYAIAVYTERGSDMILLNERKDAVILELKISNKADMEMLKFNKSKTLSRVVTDILHITANRQFELYVSALEAATILLDVVRRPIDDTLEDEKWLAALKAKKQGFNDAKELLASADEIAERMIGCKEVDLEEHVEENIFKKGQMEMLAEKYRDKK